MKGITQKNPMMGEKGKVSKVKGKGKVKGNVKDKNKVKKAC